jgi:hypothetical protein
MSRRFVLSVSALILSFGAFALAQSQAPAAPPKPGPEVKKMAALVGHFINTGEMDAGVMGPNSPAGKVSGTDDCKWAAGGFAVICNSTFDMGGTKSTSFVLTYFDPQTKSYQYYAVDNWGTVEQATGTVDAGTWTWTGKMTMGGQVMYTRFISKMTAKGFDWTMAGGDSEASMKEGMRGKEVRVPATAKPAAAKPATQ